MLTERLKQILTERLKQRKIQIAIAGVAGVMLLGAGISASRFPVSDRKQPVQQPGQPWKSAFNQPIAADIRQVKQINALKSLPPQQRTEKLTELAKANSPGQNRARYLLAIDLMQQGQAGRALEQLQGLEQSYTPMAAQVLLKQAQATEQTGDKAKAEALYQDVLKRHGQNPVAAEALLALGRRDRKYEDQAIAQFPSHPRTIDLVQRRLKQNPNQPQLMLTLARHGLHTGGYTEVLDKLVEQAAGQLQPQDWEAIAFGYWEKQQYGKAAAAYARAPYTPRNAYRIARGSQLGEREGATQAYQQMVRTFPNDPETAQALIRLSRITEAGAAIGYLDQVISRFPAKADEALLAKAKLLDGQNNPQAATQTRRTLLDRYPNSGAAAELRWTIAQQYANAKDIQTAWRWAEPILQQNPDSEFSPQAGFWVGKWAQQLGKQAEARSAYEWVLKHYPQSYYAWRSASLLGWSVGDFDSTRQLNPSVTRPATRPELPVGSATLKELHQLGQDQEAWALWQTEFQNLRQPTVSEQFTDGIMRLGVGDYLDGIFMVSYLSERERPEEQAQSKALQQQSAYWRSLYPFPFLESIETWSQQRQLNPLLVTALIRQESRFMPGVQSSAGAKGLMQVMPDTGSWIASKIQLKQYRLEDPNDNIKLGTWYLDYTHREYQGNSMLAVASYNAGPGAVGGWLEKGITDPDAFVEAIPYNETKGYVKSVFENYWNYLRLYNPEVSQQLAQISQQQRSIASQKDEG
jgi:soluble lytic murein transglycosylase